MTLSRAGAGLAATPCGRLPYVRMLVVRVSRGETRKREGLGMRQRLRTRSLVLTVALVAGMVLGPAVANAHPVSQFGEPVCFGMRISHGSASFNALEGHGMTPGERVAALQEVVDFILEFGSPEEMELVEEFFGESVSVKEFIRFVKVNCSDDPILLPF